MPVTIKISRSIVSSGSDGISWSQDGRLAVVTSQSITILSPSRRIPEEADEEEKKKDLRYDTNYTIPLDEVKSYYNEIVSANDQQYSLTATTSEIVFVNADWSPPGMTFTRGCLLATLTSRGEVIIFEQQGNPWSTKWKVKINLSQLMLDELTGNDGGGRESTGNAGDDEGIKRVLNDFHLRSLRIHSLSWSERIATGQGGNNWGTCLLAVGSESGYVTIFEINSEKVVNVGGFEIGNDDWVTGLKWSTWRHEGNNTNGGSQDNGNSATHSKSAIISVSTFTNRVITKVVNWKNEVILRDKMDVDGEEFSSPTPQLILLEGEVVLPSTRFLLSVQRWHHDKTTGIDTLAVVRIRHLDVFLFSKGKCTKKLNFVTDFSSLPTALLIHKVSKVKESSSSLIQITTTSCKGESFSVNIGLNSASPIDLTDSSSNNSLTDVISSFVVKRKKRTTDSLVTALVNFECFGAVVHPHGTYIALAYTLTPIEKLRYPILSQQSCRVVFLPLSNDESLQTLPIPTDHPVKDGASISTWWEIQTLQKFISKSDREKYMSHFIEMLQKDKTDRRDTIDTNRNLGIQLNKALFNPQIDKFRLLLHFGIGDSNFILKQLANIVLNYVNHAREGSEAYHLKSLDRAILLSYNQITEGESVPFEDGGCGEIDISGGFFVETFDFASEESRNSDSITSKTGVLWRRCSVTLLPLTLKDIVTCEGCQLKRIKCVPEENKLVSEILRVADVCIYCGSHYHER